MHSIKDSYLTKCLKETSLTKFRLHITIKPMLTIYYTAVAQGVNYVTFMYPIPTILGKPFPAALNHQGRTLPSVHLH